MVEEHLAKVFSTLFHVDGEELLQPEGELDQIVPFELSGKFARRPRRPKLFKIKPVGGVDEDVLGVDSQYRFDTGEGTDTHHAH